MSLATMALHLFEPSPDLLLMTSEEIITLIPHRYPMLLVDRLENIFLGEKATGIKNVTLNEWFFTGHFPEKPVMPGVFIVEALAQTAGALVMKSSGATQKDHLVYFMSIEKAHFRKPVVPGDTLKLQVTKRQRRSNVWKFFGEAFVEGKLVADATYTAMIVKKEL